MLIETDLFPHMVLSQEIIDHILHATNSEGKLHHSILKQVQNRRALNWKDPSELNPRQCQVMKIRRHAQALEIHRFVELLPLRRSQSRYDLNVEVLR
jgi:hypothetical protein